MVSSVEDFLLEYDYKISLSVDQSSASEEEGVGGKAGPRAGGWEIVILEVSFKIDSALTLTFRAPQLKEITINLCELLNSSFQFTAHFTCLKFSPSLPLSCGQA